MDQEEPLLQLAHHIDLLSNIATVEQCKEQRDMLMLDWAVSPFHRPDGVPDCSRQRCSILLCFGAQVLFRV